MRWLSAVSLLVTVARWHMSVIGQPQSSAGCPSGCLCPSQMDHISCANAGLVEVPRTGISPTVTSLDMSDNQLTMLTSGSLVALRNVVKLKLDNNQIERILDGAFELTPSLQNLHLGGNNLTTIQRHAFRGAEMLLHLDLSDNRLTTVDGAFAGLRHLSRLDLRNNRLSEITQFTFRDQLSLRYLLLSENHIVHVDRQAFRGLEKLMYLVLRRNPIGSVHRFQFQFHSLFLSYVDLSECHLAEIPRGLPASIRYLQLRRNNMTAVHRSSFRDCPFVSILVLDENSISDIEDGAFQNMPYLQQLWINHNRLTQLPVGLPGSVRRLLVESNSIRALTADAFPAEGSQLTALSLAGNHISTLQRGDLLRLPLLRALDLSVNNIRRLHADVFFDNPRLRSLQLSRNPLSHVLSKCFRGLKALRRLSLAFVPSAEVNVAPDAFDNLPALTALDLDSSPAIARSLMQSDTLLSSLFGVKELGLLNTQLVGIRPDLPSYLPELVVVRLSSSRWHCDAPAATWMRAWMASTGVELIGAGEILCLTPPELRGRSLLTLADWELDGEVPTAPIVFRRAKMSTTIRPNPHHPTPATLLDWLPRRPVDLDEYVDNMDIDFQSAIYDHDKDDGDNIPDTSYDLDDNRSSDVPEVAKSSSTSPMTSLEVPVIHGRLQPTYTNAVKESSTTTPRLYKSFVAPEAETPQPSSSGGVGNQNLVVLLVVLTVLATAVIVVLVIVAMVMMTRRREIGRKRHSTSIELHVKPTLNGVSQNCGGALNGRTASRRPQNADSSLTEEEEGELSRPQRPLVAFTDHVGSALDDPGAMGLSCSVEALSLIPGRDINHEGPHRVYQWADF